LALNLWLPLIVNEHYGLHFQHQNCHHLQLFGTGVGVTSGVDVFVDVSVGVPVGVHVLVGVNVAVKVGVGVIAAVLVGARVLVGTSAYVLVDVGIIGVRVNAFDTSVLFLITTFAPLTLYI